nr:hypothetical protein [Hyphomicrobium sp. 99]
MIFAAPLTICVSVIENDTDALEHLSTGFRFGEPDWQKDLENVGALDLVGGPISDHRKGVPLKHCEPLD